MEMKEKFIDFEKCAKALYIADKNLGSKKKWPPRSFQDVYLFSSTLAGDLFRIANLIKNPKKMATNIYSPAAIWKLITFSINGMRNKPEDWPKKKREFTVSSLISIANEKKESDVYCETGKNKLKVGIKQIRVALENEPLKEQKEASVLKSTLWLFCESIYYMMHNLGVEVHGPYDFEDKVFLIHDFYNIRPLHIWPDADYLNDSKVEKITMVSAYKNIEMRFDVFNNYYTESGNISEPENVWTLVNDDFVTEVKDTTVNFQKQLMQAYEASMKLTETERLKKEIEILWSTMKPWKELLYEDWHPAKLDDMVNAIPKKKKYIGHGFVEKFNVSNDLTPTGEEILK